MNEQSSSGVINPYALVEILAGGPIRWGNAAQTRALFEAVLGQRYERLFDPEHGSLLYVRERGQIGGIAFDAASRKAALEALAARSQAPISSVIQRFRATDDGVRTALTLLHEEPGKSLEWVDLGNFFSDTAEYSDPIQGALGDCYLIANLSALAWTHPELITQRKRSIRVGQPGFVDVICFYESGKSHWVEGTEKVPVAKTTHRWHYAHSSDAGEIWPAVYEKLYAKWKTGNQTDEPHYASIAGGNIRATCGELTGKPTVEMFMAEVEVSELFDFIAQRSDPTTGKVLKPTVAGTYHRGSVAPEPVVYADVHLAANHAYTVLGYSVVDGQRYVILRNPWAKAAGSGNGDLAGSWNGINLNHHGVFGLRLETFKLCYRRVAGTA